MSGWIEREPQLGGGLDYITDWQDPDDTIRGRRRSDTYPRFSLDPGTGKLYLGDGTAVPLNVWNAAAGGVIVAAADSPRQWRAMADYEVTTLAAEWSLTPATIAAQSLGMAVVLAPGNYSIKDFAWYMKAGVVCFGFNPDDTIIEYDDASSVTTMIAAQGTSGLTAGTRLDGWGLRNVTLNANSRDGHGLHVQWSAKGAGVDGVRWAGFHGAAILARGWWDSPVRYPRFDGCGSNNETTLLPVDTLPVIGTHVIGAITYYSLHASGEQDNCNNIRVTDVWFESSSAVKSDAFLVEVSGSGSEDTHNNNSFVGGKVEARSVGNAPTVYRKNSSAGLIEDVRFTIGAWNSAATKTAAASCPVIHLAGTRAMVVADFHPETISVSPDDPTVDSFLYLDGTYSTEIRGIKPQISSGNKPNTAVIEFAGTNIDYDESGTGWRFDGTSQTCRWWSGRPSHVGDRRATARQNAQTSNRTTATLTDDEVCSGYRLHAGKSYTFEGQIAFTDPGAAGLKFAIVFSTGTGRIRYSLGGYVAGSDDTLIYTEASTITLTAVAASKVVTFRGTIETSTAAEATLNVQTANAGAAGTLTINEGTYLNVTPSC